MKAKLFLFLLALSVSIILGVLRVVGEKGESFQAIAHLWVGGLFVAGIRHRPVLWIAIALSLVELFCFLVGDPFPMVAPGV